MSDVAAMYADMKRYRDEAVRLQQEVIVWQQEAQSAERKAAARIAELEADIDRDDEWAKGFIEKTAARIAELEAALKPIIPDTALDEEEYSMVWNYHLVKARAALGENDDSI